MDGPTLEQFQALLAELVSSAVPFAGVVYRSSTPKYATEADLLTGAGGIVSAGRWNPKGMALVYLTSTAGAALEEALAHYRYYGIPVHQAMPRTIVSVEAKLNTVLDIRDPSVLGHLGVTEEQFTALDWRAEVKAGREPLTHRLIRAAQSGPWEGLIVPSAAVPGQHNLLVFPGKLGPGSSLNVVNSDKLGKS
jgi:RES domain-containing protein